ncbi:MAG: hypothetical protein ACOX62_02125 [Christensenellales bacterium]
MRILHRPLAFLLPLVLIAVFYVFAVMMENEESKRTNEFVVAADAAPLQPISPLQSRDARQLANAFGLAFPLPEGFQAGEVSDGIWHTYPTRQITLQGSQATVHGIRPAAAAAALLPKDAVFTASSSALMGYPMMEAQADGRTFYAFVTQDAAFLLIPHASAELSGYRVMSPDN